MDSFKSNPRNTLPIMEPLLPYFYSVNFLILCNFDARFLRPDFTKKKDKNKIQKKEKVKEKKNDLEV